MMAGRSDGQELDPFCARELLESVGAKLGATIHIEVKRPKAGQIHNERNDKMKTEWIQCRSKENSSAA